MTAAYDLEPPFDPDHDTLVQTPEAAAEQAVLGAMLLDPTHAIPAVSKILRGPDYAAPIHEQLHDTLLALHSTDQPIDPVTLADHLKTRPSAKLRGKSLLDEIGAPYLHTLTAACPTTANADHYAEIVRLAARRRTIQTTGARLTDIARNGPQENLDAAIQLAYDALDQAAGDYGPTATPPTTWAPVDLNPVLAGEYLDPPPTMLRRNDGIPLLYDGGVHTISGESESGKAQPYTSIIQTPTGPVQMGNLHVGDQLLGVDGQPQKVEAIYERGVRQVWEVTTSDGVVVECCDEHLWAVQDVNDRHRADRYRTLTTAELADTVRWPRGAVRWALPPVGAAAYDHQPLLLDPYLLGVLLGDGHLGRDVRLSTADPQIRDTAVALAPGDLTARHDGGHDYTLTGRRGQPNPLIRALRDMGLIGTHSHSKFVPVAYLTASIDQRLALLQGLMDTDGGIENRSATFTTTSPWLADAVARIVRSLGGTAAPNWRPRHLDGVRHRDACTIIVRLPLHLPPFRLTRKAQAYAEHATRREPNRTIRTVTPTGRHVPMRCIAVSNPDHLYLTDGYVPTHNTWLTLLAALQLLEAGERVLFVDFEDRADRVIARLLALGATPTQIRAGFNYIRPDRPLDDQGRQQLAPALAGVRLVILDGVTEAMTLHGYDLNANQDSALFQALLPRWIADHGPAVAMIDHVVKDKEKQDRHAIGAQHKLAGIDGAAYMVKMIQPFARGKRGIAQILIAKDRPGYVREQAFGKVIAEFALDGSIDGIAVVAELTPPGRISGKDQEGKPFEPTHIMEKISRFVQANPGLSKKAIEDLVNGRASIKRSALELLVVRGYIRVEHGPKNAQLHHSVRPYFEADDTTEPAPHTTGDTHPDDDTGDTE